MKPEEKKRRARVSVYMRKKLKELAEEKAEPYGSLNGYINYLVEKDIKKN